MKKILFMPVVLLPILLSGLVFNFEVENPNLSRTNNNYRINSIPGEPELPYLITNLLLPQNHKVIDYAYNTGSVNTTQKTIPIASSYYILSDPKTKSKRSNTSAKNVFLPENQIKYLGTSYKNGYAIASFKLFPYQYNPISETISWSDDFQLVVDSEIDFNQKSDLLSLDQKIQHEVTRLVSNPEMIRDYQKKSSRPTSNIPSADNPFDLIIVTNQNTAPFFDQYVEWKNSQNIITDVVTTEDIYSQYSGEDDPTKIRNYLIDAYQTYNGTEHPLEYVILGGDDEIVPIRRVYVTVDSLFAPGYEYHIIEPAMPCDYYYSALDGDWNANGNEHYGQVDDEVDMYGEFAIGRISAETVEEFDNFFAKNYYYTDVNSYSNKQVYFIGEDMDWTPQTWAGDYMDELLPYFPHTYDLYTMYDRDGTNSPTNVINALDSGIGFVNHLGHSNSSFTLGVNSTNVDNLTNTEYPFIYTQGCHAAAFEQATSGDAEAIGEHFTNNQTGAFAFIGNTRFGWGQIGSTDGGSQAYHHQFLHGMFDLNIREIGKANSYSRDEMAPEALDNEILRWIFYELTLLGDPSTRIKDPDPALTYVVPVELEYYDNIGDGDGNLNPGETIDIFVELKTLDGWADANNVVVNLIFDNDQIEIINSNAVYGEIAAGDSLFNANPFTISIPADFGYNDVQYQIEVSAGSCDNSFTNIYEESFEINLNQQKWPWQAVSSFKSNPLVMDIFDNNKREIIAVDADVNINILDYESNNIDQYPISINSDMTASVASADLNSDGITDLVYVSTSGQVRAIELDGSEIFSRNDLFYQTKTPVLADVNGDGELNIITFGLDRNLHCFMTNGEELSGYPILLDELINGEIAAADLDDDANCEIIFGDAGGLVHALKYDGSEVLNFPVALSETISSSSIILDINNIVVGTADHKINMIDKTGNILTSVDIDGNIVASAVAANMDGDSDLEIIFSTSTRKIYMMKQTGEVCDNFPIELNSSIQVSPIIADIDNDNHNDIIQILGNGNLAAYDNSGTEFTFSPVEINQSGATPPTIADIDLDNDFEVTYGTGVTLQCIDLKLTKGTSIPWTTFRGNYKRTGYYGDNIEEDEQFYTKSNFNSNYPNPFKYHTIFRFEAARESQNYKFKIYNVKGQKIRTLSGEILNSENAILWDGRDDYKCKISSGVYLIELIIDDKIVGYDKITCLK